MNGHCVTPILAKGPPHHLFADGRGERLERAADGLAGLLWYDGVARGAGADDAQGSVDGHASDELAHRLDRLCDRLPVLFLLAKVVHIRDELADGLPVRWCGTGENVCSERLVALLLAALALAALHPVSRVLAEDFIARLDRLRGIQATSRRAVFRDMECAHDASIAGHTSGVSFI